MDLELDPDLTLFHETTARLLADTCGSVAVRALADHRDGFERTWWRQGAELGWTAMLVPEAHGGGRLTATGVPELAIVAESFGSHVAPGPLVPTTIVAAALAHAVTIGRNAERAARVLAGIADGSVVGAWAATHERTVPGAGADRSLRVVGDGDDRRLTGRIGPVEAAGQADVLLCSALGDDGPVLVLVAATAPGLTRTDRRGLDLVRRYATVECEHVALGDDAVVIEGSAAPGLAEHLLDLAVVLQCAEVCGILARTFAMTLDYLGARVSFGRSIGSYQAIKHRMADHKLTLEASHAAVEAAVDAIDAGRPDASEAASVAKAYIGSRATAMLQDFVQLHGGIGVTWEHDLHLFLRRATVAEHQYGDAAYHRERILRFL